MMTRMSELTIGKGMCFKLAKLCSKLKVTIVLVQVCLCSSLKQLTKHVELELQFYGILSL